MVADNLEEATTEQLVALIEVEHQAVEQETLEEMPMLVDLQCWLNFCKRDGTLKPGF